MRALGSGLRHAGRVRPSSAFNLPMLATPKIAQRTFFTEIASQFALASQAIQSTIQDVHTATGLPWWLSIASSTILVRSATFPLLRQQIIVSRKIGAAAPDVKLLTQLLLSRLRTIPADDVNEKFKTFQVFFKGVRASLTTHKVYISEIFLYPILNITVFATFVFSVRDMVLHGAPSLGIESGGFAWFKDLTELDRTYALPITALGLSYTAIEIATGKAQGRLSLIIKDTLQTVILLSLPMVTQLPAGVFCYWIPSSCFAIAQSIALKNPAFQRFFRLPEVKTR